MKGDNMLILPKKLNVGPIIYDVLFPYNSSEDSSFVGLHEPLQSRIKIANVFENTKLSVPNIHQTFLHEIFHAIDHIYCGDTINSFNNSDDIIEQLSKGWYQVLYENRIFTIKSLPKTIRMAGMGYKITTGYKFEDHMDASYWIRKLQNEICLGKGNSDYKFGEQYIFQMFIFTIHQLVWDIYYSDNKEDKLDRNIGYSFSNGILQVFRDNKIEQMLKKGCVK